METIDYPTRKDLVEALVDARSRGVHVEVVGNGRTLKFPNGFTENGQAPAILGHMVGLDIEKEAPADGIEKTPVEGDTLVGVVEPEDEQMDRSAFTIEGTCSECGEDALAEPDGTWVHTEAATHGDNEGTFVPYEPAAEDEDLIGAPAPEASKTKRKSKGN